VGDQPPTPSTVKARGRALAPPHPLSTLRFSLLAVVIGAVAGLGAVAFRGLIALFHNILFLRTFSFTYDANVHTPASPWGIWVILIPVLGAFGVAFLVKNFAPEAKGHGVPEVMDAIYYNKGVIRPVVAVIKSLASALSIGSGGAIGREGPIIQIGSSFGSTLGQLIRLPMWQRITLVAAGAGGGIAATFNTPVGGVLFAVEIMMHEVSVRTLVPVAISTATATYLGRIFFGPHPSFIIPGFENHYFHLTNPAVLLTYVGLGILMGLVSALYIKSIYGFEDFFEKRIKGGYYVRHMSGMLVVGVMMFVLFRLFGHYYVEGVGYATVQDVLTGKNSVFLLLLLLAALKLLATALTLGSGASGGIFSPALFMGATLGGAYGILLQKIFPDLGVSAPAFAVAGMAGVVGGSTGAAMAAIVMIFEMTLDYSVIVPMTITVALSYEIRKLISRESIYTLKLVRRGHSMPESLQANFHHMQQARNVMDTRLVTVPAEATLDRFVRSAAHSAAVTHFLVVDANGVIGVLTPQAAISALAESERPLIMKDLAHKNFIAVPEDVTLFDVMSRLRLNDASVALVTRRDAGADPESEATAAADVVGIIDKDRIADTLVEAIELFSD
jgi:CIC family chloride channel protein